MQKQKLIYIGFSFLHHGKFAGYDQLRKYMHYTKVIDCQKSFVLFSKISKPVNYFNKIYLRIFQTRLWWVEIWLILISLFSRNCIFHIIYGENIYRYLGYFKGKNKIALTLHQPPSFFDEQENRFFTKALRHVDKIIVMSIEMKEYFSKKFPEKDIAFIPHGVDSSNFKPEHLKLDKILLIGNWLRDFEFASKVFLKLEQLKVRAKIDILTDNANYHYFEKCTNISLLSKISDADLLKLYQESKLVFLPLKQFTANNALLEACSCGCQVLVATNPENFILDNESPILFIENSVDKVVAEIIEILNSWNIEKENKNRSYILDNYRWEIIAEKTTDFLMDE